VWIWVFAVVQVLVFRGLREFLYQEWPNAGFTVALTVAPHHSLDIISPSDVHDRPAISFSWRPFHSSSPFLFGIYDLLHVGHGAY
jgi:hypothetical protein